MRTPDLIAKKRDGEELSARELRSLVEGFCAGHVADYQMSAFLMAARIRGLTRAEAFALTEAMADSGRRLNLSSLSPTVDKHSTGGVGDKTTLVVAPLAAAAGLTVAKMSGRSLAHTGGTIDKLEAIPGLRVELSKEAFLRQAREVGVVVASATADLAPADKRIYALRDVTATVDSTGLIAASVMSKKLAAGAEAIVLDVKCGEGAFMRSRQDAQELAELMVDIGRRAGRRVAAVISNMDEPLGRAVGNACEVEEAMATLCGGGPADLRELCLQVAGRMIALGGVAETVEQGVSRAEELLTGGAGLHKLRQMVAAQGGDAAAIDQPERLPRAAHAVEVQVPESGYVRKVRALPVGKAAMVAGAGRPTLDSPVDYGAGVYLHKASGDEVRGGETVATVWAPTEGAAAEAAELVRSAYQLASQPPPPRRLLLGSVPD